MINSDYFKTGLRSKRGHWQHLLGMQKMACLEEDRGPDGHTEAPCGPTLTVRLCLSAMISYFKAPSDQLGVLI